MSMTPPLADHLALRLGLAARLLPEDGLARLMTVLESALGLPLTAEKLNQLRVNEIKTAAGGVLADVDAAVLKTLVAVLKGETMLNDTPPPPCDPYRDGDLPASIRVACASNGGELLDGHFGVCRRFLIYQVAAHAVRLIECRTVNDSGADDKNSYRAGLIADCQLLYVVSIGGPAAAKVVKRRIHPLKVPEGGVAREHMQQLSALLDHHAPPWLAKIMGNYAPQTWAAAG